MEGYQYVVHKKKKPKVAFLSGQNRKLLQDRKAYNRLDCQTVNKPQNELGPGCYPDAEKLNSAFSRIENQVVSKMGVSGLASKSKRIFPPRAPDGPSPTNYQTGDPFQVKRVNLYPFNSTTARQMQVENDVPGVCIYDTRCKEKDHSIPFEHSFGGRTKLKPVIMVKCTPENRDVCRYCSERPVGDYWISTERDGNTVCTDCYISHKLYQKTSFDPNKPKYQKIRDCSFVHSHEGTTAALPLMSDKDVLKQTIRECYFSTYMPTHVIKKKEPRTNFRKSHTKNSKEISCGDSDSLFKKMSKFIHDLYSEPEAEYLRKRNISNERVQQILTPLSLVPNMETLTKHLITEQEPYKLRDFPMRTTRFKEKIDIDKICETWDWKYKEIEYNRDDIIKEQQIPDEVVCRLRKGSRQPHLTTSPPLTPYMSSNEMTAEKQELKKNEKGSATDINNYLWCYFKNSENNQDYEEIPIISEALQYAISLIPTELKDYPIEKEKEKVIKVAADGAEIKEKLPQLKREWSELDLMQDPDIPPMPRPFRPGDEPMDRSGLDPDIASMFDDSDRVTPEDRSLSVLTVGSQYGYPQLKF